MGGVKGFGATTFVVDLQTQRHWDWQVATYLYGFGAAAGLAFVSLVMRSAGRLDASTATAVRWTALIAALVALVFLFSHLGPQSRWRAFYVFRRPHVSWTARGATIATALVFCEALALLPGISDFEALHGILDAAIMLLAMAFMLYSGLLLSSWNSIAFWNTPALPILFLANALLCGLAVLVLVSFYSEGAAAPPLMAGALRPYLLMLLGVNALVLLLYLWNMSTATLPARESVRRLLRGRHRSSFWFGTVGAGLALPTAVLAVDPAGISAIAVACLAIQIGGYLMRDNVLRVGIYGYPI